MRRPLIAATCAALAAAALAGTLWAIRPQWLTSALRRVGAEPSATPDPQRYATLCADLATWRTNLSRDYQAARTPAQKAQVLATARGLLEGALPEMMRCWLGTPWDFNGTASTPGTDPVACGYFVTTVLRDAGFAIERTRLAQQASQQILATFVPREAMTLRVGTGYQEFCSDVAGLPPGVYILGLDTHVSFLVLKDGQFHVNHSSGIAPWCVVEETAAQADTVRHSRYRVLGNLTAQPQVLEAWLTGQPLRPPQAD